VREFFVKVMATAQVMFYAVLPAGQSGVSKQGTGKAQHRRLNEGEAQLCEPRQIRGGTERLLNARGELQLFFPHCLAIAAPAILFRLKREGFSRCSVEASDRGLLVRGWR
jgi:hypothetical protein